MKFLVISCTVDIMVYSMKYIWSSNMACWKISQLVRRFSQLQTFLYRICSVAGGYIMLIHVIYLDISRNKQVYIMWIFHGISPANSLDKWHFFGIVTPIQVMSRPGVIKFLHMKLDEHQECQKKNAWHQWTYAILNDYGIEETGESKAVTGESKAVTTTRVI